MPAGSLEKVAPRVIRVRWLCPGRLAKAPCGPITSVLPEGARRGQWEVRTRWPVRSTRRARARSIRDRLAAQSPAAPPSVPQGVAGLPPSFLAERHRSRRSGCASRFRALRQVARSSVRSHAGVPSQLRVTVQLSRGQEDCRCKNRVNRVIGSLGAGPLQRSRWNGPVSGKARSPRRRNESAERLQIPAREQIRCPLAPWSPLSQDGFVAYVAALSWLIKIRSAAIVAWTLCLSFGAQPLLTSQVCAQLD